MNIKPRLTLQKTLSHPADEAETGLVLGFTGRNVLLGHDALILKGDELPTVRDAPAVTHYIIPDEQTEVVLADDVHVYILGEHTVYHVDPIDVSKSPQHTGSKYRRDVSGRKVPVGKMRQWPREQVEVSN